MCYSFEFVESCASLMLLHKVFQDLLAKRGWFMILFFAVFIILSLIEFYFRSLILRGTSGWLGPLHNWSNIFLFIGFIFTMNYAKV